MIVALIKLPVGGVDVAVCRTQLPSLHLNPNRTYTFSPGGPCICSLLVRLLDGPFTGHLLPI